METISHRTTFKSAELLETRIHSVPYSAIDRFEDGFLETWLNRVEDITNQARFIGGEWPERLERRLASDAQVKEVRTCANGTDAIQLALRAVGVSAGDTVVVPDLTFWATYEAVCNVGARPVTLDVSLDDFHLSPELLELALKKFSPAAVILVHLFGWVAGGTKAIRRLCNQARVPLIEDSAQAWGSTLHGKPVFSDAQISTVSFFPGKVLGGAGDGGAVLANDPELAEKVGLLANHGRTGKFDHQLVGWNSRMDALQAAYVDLSLDYLPGRLASRRRAVQWYRENLTHSQIQLMAPSGGVGENGYLSVALLAPSTREKLLPRLDEAKVGYGTVYPRPIRLQPGARSQVARSLSLGHVDRFCQSVLNLPCFSGITEDELRYVKTSVETSLL